jgi:hypothetical protein
MSPMLDQILHQGCKERKARLSPSRPGLLPTVSPRPLRPSGEKQNIAGAEKIESSHFLEAIQYRSLDRDVLY